MKLSALFGKSRGPVRDGMVTVVIAAYGRLDTLNTALESVYRQTCSRWRVLVVGDCCSREFLDGIDTSHRNVRVINLPIRSGTQHGPNSVGIHLAESQYIAFLNHDDIWLEDHLEIAIQALEREGANYFMGKAAFCYRKGQEEFMRKHGRLMFSEYNRPDILWHCIHGPSYLYEPVSCWVLNTAFAKQVGYWDPPGIGFDYAPMLKWLKRAVRANARFCFSDLLTVLKFQSLQVADPNRPRYEQSDALNEHTSYFMTLTPEKTRELVTDDVKQSPGRGALTRRWLYREIEWNDLEKALLSQFLLFAQTGVEHELFMRGNDPDKFKFDLRTALRMRTGEEDCEFPTAERILSLMSL